MNDLLINDVTTDIRKEKNIWNIFVTIFLETIQSKKENLSTISCHVASILHVSQNELISNTSEIMLDTSEKYININISITVPAVSSST